MASTFTLDRGILYGEVKDTSETIYKDELGVECERCPFCGALVPLDVSTCRGCGARKSSGIKPLQKIVAVIFVLLAIMLFIFLAVISH